MKKLLNDHNNNLKIKNEKHLTSPKVMSKAMSEGRKATSEDRKAMSEPTLYKSMMRVQKDFLQQQGKAQAKSRLEEVKKKFINLLMRSGEKSKAHKLFRDSLNLLEKKSMTITALKLSSPISRGDVRVEAVSKGEERFAPPISKGDVNKMLGVTAYKRDSTDKNSSVGKKHSILCDNKAELFKFYTVYNRVEKNGSFEKNEKLKDTSVTSPILSPKMNKSEMKQRFANTTSNKSTICPCQSGQSDVKAPLTLSSPISRGGVTVEVVDLLHKGITTDAAFISPKVICQHRSANTTLILKSAQGVKPKVVLREDLLVQSPSNIHIAKRSYKDVTSHITETMKSPLERAERSVKKGDVKRDISTVMSTRSGVGTKNSVPKSLSSRAKQITKGNVKSDLTKVIKDFTPKNNKSENKNTQENSHNDFLKNHILYQAIENIKPPLELRRVRKGGTTYQVPAIVSQKKQERLAIKWIIESACKRKSKKGNSFSESLVTEILEAFHKTGQPRQKRDEMLKIAEFNRAYTRYRWW